MAKYNPVTGKRIGKVGGEVYAVVKGEAIVREKPLVVSNPSTDAQVAVRAKLKLMSQLSAVLGPVIAVRREGIKSPRNLFVKQNYGLATYNNSIADVNLNRVQITKSAVGLVGFEADRSSGNICHVALMENAAGDYDRIVYVECAKLADGTLRLLDTKVVKDAGLDGKFGTDLEYTANAVVIYAYGMRDNSDASRATFGNLTAPSAEDVAKIIVSRSLTLQDVTLTETLGLSMQVGEDTGTSESFDRATITLTSSGSGTVSGAGLHIIGQTATVHAHPVNGAEFVNWREGNASGLILSTSPDYSFTVTEDITLHATFTTAPCIIAVSADPNEGGAVTGNGTYTSGDQVTVRATPAAGYVFNGWFENDQLVSGSAAYTFEATINRNLVAKFRQLATYTITPQSANPTMGSVSGGGQVTEGQSTTVVATPASGYQFKNWRANSASGQILSTDASYTLTPSESMTLYATFEEFTGLTLTVKAYEQYSQNYTSADNNLQVSGSGVISHESRGNDLIVHCQQNGEVTIAKKTGAGFSPNDIHLNAPDGTQLANHLPYTGVVSADATWVVTGVNAD